jgi:AcrR family transcriptional regulator
MVRGRPREFDVDVALDQATELFWRQGYEGTSLNDLTKAMGIAPPSLYAAFGNKRQLFERALERYAEPRRGKVEAALEAPTASEAMRAFLEHAVRDGTTPGAPPGCLTITGGLAHSDDEDVSALLTEQRRLTELALQKRLKRAIADGDLSSDASPTGLARYFATVAQGIAVQASTGVSRKALASVVEAAVAVLHT